MRGMHDTFLQRSVHLTKSELHECVSRSIQEKVMLRSR